MDQRSSVDSVSEEEKPSLTEERASKIYFSWSNNEMEGTFHSQLNERVRPYLDLIDSLRLMGINEDLALPAIAVIGDQSSGKSSVLEALSGVALPRGSGIVTRCPLMLKLRKLSERAEWKAIISYKDMTTEFTDPSMVEEYVNAAQNELAGDGVGICDELISLEILSPDVCDLTLIDLPGIARVPVKGQPEDIGDQIKRLILSFIEKSETINLVVVPCNVDIATTEALKMAQEVDADGKRTLAILTKPDLVDRGTEKNVLDIVHNRVIPLSKGYIVVKCRGQQQIQEKVSLVEATKRETDFFRQHKYFRVLLKEDKATTQCLATKLTQDLVDHIKKALPTLSEQVKMDLWNSRKLLSECPEGPPSEPQQKKAYLVDILSLFNENINSLSAGEVVNEENLFIILRSHFQRWSDDLQCSQASFGKMMEDVGKEYDLKHRGRELPGFSDYKVFEIVVQRLVMKLLGPALDTLKIIRETVQAQFIDISKMCFSTYPFLDCVAVNKIDKIQSRQEAKVEERIREQFEMEKLVYTQDTIYLKSLTKMEESSPVNWADFDTRNKYPEMFQSYYEIVIQRLADQIPMLIRFFLLKESARVLCSEMLGLIEGVDLEKALCESSDGSRNRHDLLSRIERLSEAQEKLSRFI
ncbi:interferon-induced GTP-binding protein Mx2-like isoform X2 [Sardina pilchardus]